MTNTTSDSVRMRRALELGAAVRALTPPNPWVGCVLVTNDGSVFEGATAAVGGPHAEAAALAAARAAGADTTGATRSEEHTSELQSLMRISYAVFCLKKKKKKHK